MKLYLQSGCLNSITADQTATFQLTTYETQVVTLWQAIIRREATYQFTTSGSTGVPQVVILSLSQLNASVDNTARYFGIEAGQTLLCCLNVSYIAGFMMLFRAVRCGADCYVVAPAADPFGWIASDIAFDFVSMVPLQFQYAVTNQLDRLRATCRQVLLGGAAINLDQRLLIEQLSLPIWIGYGMTETASHIGLMRLSGPHDTLAGQPAYVLFDNIEAKQDVRGCLMVRGAVTDNQWVLTNDLVDLQGRLMVYQGRADRVFNSGGLKVSADWVEQQIAPIMSQLLGPITYWVTAIADERLGQKIVLLIEAEVAIEPSVTNDLIIAFEAIDQYKMPKIVVSVPQLVRTSTGKIDLLDNQQRLERIMPA